MVSGETMRFFISVGRGIPTIIGPYAITYPVNLFFIFP
ncbi:hypothetical protein HNR46_000538 [Haloferula luteola]|uniref:Uncharacterized protein n=1 Tax=Haloferula luteola TaxID=595692 RepID=A0A840V3T6_9BACT|nr:hypothetical protein [Haloferula luteola]